MNLKHVLREYMHWYYLFLRKPVVWLAQPPFFLLTSLETFKFGIVMAVYTRIHMKIQPISGHTGYYRQQGWMVTEVHLDVHKPTAPVSISCQLETGKVLLSQCTSTFHLALHTFYTREMLGVNGDSQHEANTTLLWIIAEERLNLNLNMFLGFF